MANTPSAKKRIRQNAKRRIRNRAVLSRTRSFVSKARKDIQAGDPSTARESVKMAMRELDRAASKGVLHPKNASRRKRRLAKHLASVLKEE